MGPRQNGRNLSHEKPSAAPPNTNLSPSPSGIHALSKRETVHTLISKVCISPSLPVTARERLTFAPVLTFFTMIYYHPAPFFSTLCGRDADIAWCSGILRHGHSPLRERPAATKDPPREERTLCRLCM